ncbi:glycopeptide antibiotics resistance protein [Bacillus sp. SORGH_AS 510]|uniref:VanZ family protein n=1 Tax=Bacillus sp. SORGH_AS_0510 TaxID=3041771 RepID=UPI00278116DE|nr:VanZ family protein [Bacillus sp. SORGH_AS_0510]MDQ1147932.1 glycopeptide antibiotics resistance protein [Bacillus sp. SORGH_AS_0510]
MKIIIKLGLTIILCLYLAVLTKLILFKYIPLTEIIHHFNFTYDEYHWRSNNFVPFKTIIFYLYIADVNLNIRIENLAGNVVGFIPLGFILPLLLKKFQRLSAVMAASFCLSLTYEILQLLFEFGSFDVDDLILNTLGGMLGYIPAKLFIYFMWKRKK